MTLEDLNPTLEALARCGWEEIVEQAAAKECIRYHTLFGAKARTIDSDSGLKCALSLLSVVTSFNLNLHDRLQPFTPLTPHYASRSALPDYLSAEHLDVLKGFLPKVTDPELAARIADVLWIQQHDYQIAEDAVLKYVNSFMILGEEHPVSAIERLERALQLSVALNKEGELFKMVGGKAEEALRSLDPNDASYFSHHLMDLLLRFRIGDSLMLAADAEKRARQAELQRNWHWARGFWELRASWSQKLKDAAAEEMSRKAIGETYVQEADIEAAGSSPSFFRIANHLQKAIGAYRRIPNSTERQRELPHRLLAAQKRSTDELQHISHEIDLSEPAGRARNSVKGLCLREALFHLVSIPAQPIYSQIRQDVEEQISAHPVLFLFPATFLDREGRVTFRRSSLLTDDSDAIEGSKFSEIYTAMSREREMRVIGLIDPIRRQIALEHNIRPADIASLIRFSPFVPDDHVYQIAGGLYYGFAGDFLAATHILTPQFENSIRLFLISTKC